MCDKADAFLSVRALHEIRVLLHSPTATKRRVERKQNVKEQQQKSRQAHSAGQESFEVLIPCFAEVRQG